MCLFAENLECSMAGWALDWLDTDFKCFECGRRKFRLLSAGERFASSLVVQLESSLPRIVCYKWASINKHDSNIFMRLPFPSSAPPLQLFKHRFLSSTWKVTFTFSESTQRFSIAQHAKNICSFEIWRDFSFSWPKFQYFSGNLFFPKADNRKWNLQVAEKEFSPFAQRNIW